jgi:hypothetical protein
MRAPPPSTKMPKIRVMSSAMAGVPRKSMMLHQKPLGSATKTSVSAFTIISTTGSRIAVSAAAKEGRGRASAWSPSAPTNISGTGTGAHLAA